MTKTREEIARPLQTCGQEHLLRFWDALDEDRRAALQAQIESLDGAVVNRMRELLRQDDTGQGGDLQPDAVAQLSGAARTEAGKVGEDALRAGRVGCILVAGGQGTRLGFDGPKGCYPVGPLSDQSLFGVHARKILARERQAGAPVPFYIMTSRENDAPTRAFFAEQKFFGLDPERVLFFSQGQWPAMTPDGRIVLERPDRLFMSPDGHGGLLAALRRQGLLDDMQRRGLETLFYFQVDNPLVEIADPAFVGLHRMRQAEMSVKVCEKSDPEEKVGVVARREGRPLIVEYSELTPEQMYATDENGAYRFRYGSVAIHMFALDFLRRVAADAEAMPMHKARKKVPFCDETGQTVQPTAPNAIKFEKFIFDLLPLAQRTLNLAFDRAEEFSPVKNATGPDSAVTARRDMVRKAARRLEALGVAVPRDDNGEPRHKIEIDPCAPCDADRLRERLGPDLALDRDLRL